MSKPRSLPQHNRFFALIAATYNHWPEGKNFRPQNAEHLRAWLLVKAGHFVVNTFDCGEKAEALAVMIPVITATMLKKHSWAKSDGNLLHVCVPMSIDFNTVSQADFAKLCGDVEDVIVSYTGLQIADIMRQAA
jgi:hypothetical protein